MKCRMSSCSAFVWFVFLSALAIVSQGLPEKKYRFCVVSTANGTGSASKHCPFLDSADSAAVCVVATDRLECLRRLTTGKADFAALQPEDILVASRLHNPQILITHQLRLWKDHKYDYQMVAIVRNTLNLTGLSDLRGKKFCHPGYGLQNDWTTVTSNVSYEEIHKLIINLKKVLFNSEEQSKAEAFVGKVISRAQRMLSVCKQESSEFLSGQSILISDLEFSIAECKAGYKIAFYDTASKVSPETFNKNHQRVLQRCLLIASMIKKIEVQLSDLSGVLSSCSTRKSESSIGLDDSLPYRIGQSLISLNPRQQTITLENSCSTK